LLSAGQPRQTPVKLIKSLNRSGPRDVGTCVGNDVGMGEDDGNILLVGAQEGTVLMDGERLDEGEDVSLCSCLPCCNVLRRSLLSLVVPSRNSMTCILRIVES
jgi:hypothetical protein